jgi:hypothetical protein
VAPYAQLAKDELAAQDARKASLEQRGVGVITTSGVLVTLLFGLAALSTKASDTFVLAAGARTWLLWALGLFLAAAVVAILTNLPIGYQAVDADAIRSRLKERPIRSRDAAEKDVALTRVRALEDAKTKNGFKAGALVVAMGLEVGAVGCVAAAVRLVI